MENLIDIIFDLFEYVEKEQKSLPLNVLESVDALKKFKRVRSDINRKKHKTVVSLYREIGNE